MLLVCYKLGLQVFAAAGMRNIHQKLLHRQKAERLCKMADILRHCWVLLPTRSHMC